MRRARQREVKDRFDLLDRHREFVARLLLQVIAQRVVVGHVGFDIVEVVVPTPTVIPGREQSSRARNP